MSASRLRRLPWYPALVLLGAPCGCSGATPAPAPRPVDSTLTVTAAGPPPDPYHQPPRDTVEIVAYRGWQQYSLQCARCHGEEGQGTSFAPSLLLALRSDGHASTRDEFVRILTDGRPDKGMPAASTMGLDPDHFDGLYQYLKGRSDGLLHGGRPARRES